MIITDSFQTYIQTEPQEDQDLFILQIKQLTMLRGIICLDYNVIVFKVYLFKGKIIKKYLK